MTLLERFQLGISQLELYPKDDPLVEKLLRNMATRKIVHVGKWCQNQILVSIKLNCQKLCREVTILMFKIRCCDSMSSISLIDMLCSFDSPVFLTSICVYCFFYFISPILRKKNNSQVFLAVAFFPPPSDMWVWRPGCFCALTQVLIKVDQNKRISCSAKKNLILGKLCAQSRFVGCRCIRWNEPRSKAHSIFFTSLCTSQTTLLEFSGKSIVFTWII